METIFLCEFLSCTFVLVLASYMKEVKWSTKMTKITYVTRIFACAATAFSNRNKWKNIMRKMLRVYSSSSSRKRNRKRERKKRKRWTGSERDRGNIAYGQMWTTSFIDSIDVHEMMGAQKQKQKPPKTSNKLFFNRTLISICFIEMCMYNMNTIVWKGR